MKKRNLIIVGIMLVAMLFITGISYALWQITLQQESTNIVNTACFKINFKEQNEINLQSAYPISDAEGMSLTPYTFTIENICNTNATYQINLEELTTELKKLSKEYIKISLNNVKGKILNTYETVEKTLSNAESSKKLTTGVLKAGDSKVFELRLWLDENTPAVSDVMNATFQSKIAILVVQKEGLPEVDIVAQDNLNEITVDIPTVKNPKNETLTYFYQLNEETEIESEENTHTFTGLADGKYKVSVRAETLDGVILEEKELDVTVAYETVYVSSSGNDETGNGAIDNPYATLQPAYNKVKSGGSILLLSDIRATSTTNMNIENKEVTLRSNGENIYTIIKEPDFTTQILDIRNSNTVTTTNTTFDGNEVLSSAALIEVYDSTLNLNEGTTVQKNNNRGRYYTEWSGTGALGGGLLIYQSTLNINGANIINNKTSVQSGIWSHGGGIYSQCSVLNFNSGSVSYNENIGTIENQIGGGIFFADGTLTMQDGTISYNKTLNGGGGLFADSINQNTTVFINGGNVINNIAAKDGGGIHGYVEGALTLTIYISGFVTENRADGTGGGIFINKNPDFSGNSVAYVKMSIVSNNNASTGPNTYAANGAQIIDQKTS